MSFQQLPNPDSVLDTIKKLNTKKEEMSLLDCFENYVCEKLNIDELDFA
jgi:hypothetical protein